MNLIKHVAIIMDGNGRWGLKRKKNRNYGHRKGLLTIEKIVYFSIKKKIPYLTLYIFSTENWKRPKKEINFLFKLLQNFLINNLEKLNKKKIKIKFLGSKKNFSDKLKNVIKKTEFKTRENSSIHVNLALNYGSKSEIINSFNLLRRNKQKISENNIKKNLYTSFCPDPDLLIRTGGKKRLSNFLLWQLAYSEIFFLDKLWPSFTSKDFLKILNQYKKIKRNFGNI